MNESTMTLSRVNGGICVTVHTNNPEIRAHVKALGYALVTDIANTYQIVAANPAALDAARAGLDKFFGRDGRAK